MLLAQALLSQSSLLDGTWHGTERCVEHCCNDADPAGCQGTVPASLQLLAGSGTYSVDGFIRSSELHGNFAMGHVLDRGSDASPHGSFLLQANATHAWGSWLSFATERLFHWDFVRQGNGSCSGHTPAECLESAGCTWRGRGCGRAVVAQVPVFEEKTTAPWGTHYACFRVPAAVMVRGDLLVFAESRIGSCDDQAPKDVTMRRSQDRGKTFGPLLLVVGPRRHAAPPSTSSPDFSARNPYPIVTDEGDLILNWVNTSGPNSAASWQRTSVDGGRTWGRDRKPGLHELDGTLMGPGAGIALGRHSASNRGRLVICGASGYVGGLPQQTVVWYSDDNGSTWHASKGADPSYPMPFRGLAECQVVELTNGSVVVNSRNEGHVAPHHRAVAVSNDGAESFLPCELPHLPPLPRSPPAAPEPACRLLQSRACGANVLGGPD